MEINNQKYGNIFFSSNFASNVTDTKFYRIKFNVYRIFRLNFQLMTFFFVESTSSKQKQKYKDLLQLR